MSPIQQDRPMQISKDEGISAGKILGSFIGGLKRSGSHGSLNSLMSMMDTMNKEQHFRICSYCFNVSLYL